MNLPKNLKSLPKPHGMALSAPSSAPNPRSLRPPFLGDSVSASLPPGKGTLGEGLLDAEPQLLL